MNRCIPMHGNPAADTSILVHLGKILSQGEGNPLSWTEFPGRFADNTYIGVRSHALE